MPVNCVAYGCSNKGKIDGITYHRFPKNPNMRQLWVDAVNRQDWEPTRSSLICSSHFRDADVDRTSLVCVRIRDGAVPCIFPGLLEAGRKEIDEAGDSDEYLPPESPEPIICQSSSLMNEPIGASQESSKPLVKGHQEDIGAVFIKQEPQEQEETNEEETVPNGHHFMDPGPVPSVDPLAVSTTHVSSPNPQQNIPSVNPPGLLHQKLISGGPSKESLPGGGSKINDPVLSNKRQITDSSCNSSGASKRSRIEEKTKLSKKDVIQKVLGMLEEKEDEHDIFARNVAIKLRNMSPAQGMIAEKLITQILYQGLFDKLQENTTLVNAVVKKKITE